MNFENSKKYLTTTKLITYIIINIIKLRELHMKLTTGTLLNKIIIIKDIAKFGLDIMSFNILTILLNSVGYYKKFRKGFTYIIRLIKNRGKKDNSDENVVI